MGKGRPGLGVRSSSGDDVTWQGAERAGPGAGKAGSIREACEQAAGTATAACGDLSPTQGAIGPQLYKDRDPGQVTKTRSPTHPTSIL